MDIQQALHDYIVQQAAEKAPADLDADYDLIESGLMDSLFMMGIITHLETQYQVQFGLNDIVPQNFRSIRTLTEFVRRTIAGEAATASSGD
ncbi:MAG: phosphopantetheine-binding protein [Blastocatellia bacterium]